MGRSTLSVDFQSENLAKISLKKDPQETVFVIRAKCTQCGEQFPNELYVDPQAENPLPSKGNRGSCNCVFKCKLCERQHYIDAVPDAFTPFVDGESKFSMSFDSRGCEVVDWEINPQDLTAVGEGDQEFDEIDGKDWADYDENLGDQVAIYDWTVSVDNE